MELRLSVAHQFRRRSFGVCGVVRSYLFFTEAIPTIVVVSNEAADPKVTETRAPAGWLSMSLSRLLTAMPLLEQSKHAEKSFPR